MSGRQALTPGRVLVLSFLGLIGLGTALLRHPGVQAQAQPLPFVDALFMATSAVCVTGLATVDPASQFTRPGHWIILTLIQLGGLGISVFSISLMVFLGGRLGLSNRLMLQEHLPGFSLGNSGSLVRRVLLFFLGCEALGAALLALAWTPRLGLQEAAFQGLFHSISAFCNAGFTVLPGGLVPEAGALGVNLVLMGQILLGGVGLLVCSELLDSWRRQTRSARITLHTWAVLVTSALLIGGGALLFLVFEITNPDTLRSMPVGQALLVSLFQSVTCRTAGFNTLDLAHLREETLQLMMFLMFVGGAPGSTAGGVKTTTLAVLIMAVWAQLRGHADLEIHGRRIPPQRVLQALALTVTAISAILCLSLILNMLEPQAYHDLLFEVVSALATVGLSTGVTPHLSPTSKLLLCLAMFAGRIGPMTLAASLIESEKPKGVRCPEAKILIG